jgi:hypothetical protein
MTHPTWQKILDELAAFIFVTGLISMVWELRGKRAFAAEVAETARLSERIRNASLTDVSSDFMGDVNWPGLFANAHHIDISFAYGGSWRGMHIDRLRARLRRGGALLRVILPDPADAEVIAELTRRGMVGVQQKIYESIREFEQLALAEETKADVEIWTFARSPLYSFYRFDDRILIAPYQHRTVRSTVPAFIMQRGSDLFSFFENDVTAMMSGNNPLARRVFKTP